MSDWSASGNNDTQRHLSQVARGGVLGLVGAAASAIAGFVLVLVVTNTFPTDTAGVFFTLTSGFLVLSALATLGGETGLARFLLRYEVEGRAGDIPPTIRTAVRPAALGSLALGAVIVVLAEPIAGVLGVTGAPGVTSVRVLGLLLPFATALTVLLAVPRSFGLVAPTVVIDQIARPALQPVLVLVVSGLGAGVLALTVAWSLPYAVAAVVAGLTFRRFRTRRRDIFESAPTVDVRTLRRTFWSFTWPRAITRVAQMAIQRVDIVLVAAMRSPTEAAVYVAATRFVALGQFGTQAIQQVLQPKFAALLANREETSLREVYKVATAWSMCLAWPMYVLVGCAPLAYLGLFGEAYAESGRTTVVLMSATMLLAVAVGAADTLLLMAGRSGFSMANNLVALAVDVALCLWLIPGLGITGAAVAWAVSSTIRSVLAVVQCRVTLGVVSFGRPGATAAAANLVCLALPVLALSLLTEVDLLVLALACLVLVPAYAGALWLGRGPLMLGVLADLVRRRPAAADPSGTPGEPVVGPREDVAPPGP